MRMIDADALIDNMVDYVVDGYAESRGDFEEYTKMVQTAPTIDAVSVVRCKECKHNPWNYDAEKPLEYTCIWDDDFADREQTPNDFCSYGERKGE